MRGRGFNIPQEGYQLAGSDSVGCILTVRRVPLKQLNGGNFSH